MPDDLMPIDSALYQAYIDSFTAPSQAHDRRFGQIWLNFHATYLGRYTKRQRREADRRIRAAAWDAVQQAAPTRKRES